MIQRAAKLQKLYRLQIKKAAWAKPRQPLTLLQLWLNWVKKS